MNTSKIEFGEGRMETRRIYEESSGVNIDDVYDQYDWERASGYDGEFELFKYLLNDDSLKYTKLLTNLIIPNSSGRSTTEIDMVLITHYGIIVFEVKNYKGTIYGKPEEKYWTQYFKTVPNNRFNNPIKQNEYHIQALKRLLPQKIYSVIFFSNPYCDTQRVEFSNDDYAVVNTRKLGNIMQEISQFPVILSTSEINMVFENLRKYTRSTTTKDTYESFETKDFNAFLARSRKHIDEEIEKSTKESKKAFSKKVTIILTISIIVVALCLYACLVFYENRSKALEECNKALDQYNSMDEKFSVVSESDIELSQSLLKITDVSITPHDYLKGSSLSFVINNTSKTAHIGANSKQPRVLVTLNDGSVQEYSLQKTFYPIYPGKQQVYTVTLSCQKSDIKYIKMQTLYVISNGQYTHPFSINICE